MKKIFTVLVAGLMISAQVMAVTVQDVCGTFKGMLNIGGQTYPNKSIYLLPARWTMLSHSYCLTLPLVQKVN